MPSSRRQISMTTEILFAERRSDASMLVARALRRVRRPGSAAPSRARPFSRPRYAQRRKAERGHVIETASRLIPKTSAKARARRARNSVRLRPRQPAASIRCSQLSNTISACLPRRARTSCSSGVALRGQHAGRALVRRLRANHRRARAAAPTRQPHAAGETLERIGRDLQRERCLADAARTDQRHEPMRSQQPAQRLARPRISRPTSAVSTLRANCLRETSSERSDGNLARHLRREQLINVFGPRQILEPMLARDRERYVGRQNPLQEFAGHTRDEKLAAVSDRQQPGYPVQRRTEVVAVAFVRRPGMKAARTASRQPPKNLSRRALAVPPASQAQHLRGGGMPRRTHRRSS